MSELTTRRLYHFPFCAHGLIHFSLSIVSANAEAQTNTENYSCKSLRYSSSKMQLITRVASECTLQIRLLQGQGLWNDRLLHILASPAHLRVLRTLSK